MATKKFLSDNFQVQFNTTDFAAADVPAITTLAQEMPPLCEADYAILAQWFGVAVGKGFGHSNRTIVNLKSNLNGADNHGYSTSHSKIDINPLGRTNDAVLSLFVNEMIEVLMSYKGPWDPSDSGGEGLSRMAGNILHPNSARTGTDSNVFGWLASNPALDITAAKADTEFRQDWITKNYKGGDLKQGGHQGGDEDAYSIGCAMLFLDYLKDQLGYTMPQIIQKSRKTLTGTYQRLTNDKGGGVPQFRQVVDRNFPSPTIGSSSDSPFPLFLLHQQTPLVAADLASGTLSLVAGVKLKRCDLVFIKGNNTQSGTIEVRMVAGSSDFSQVISNNNTALAEAENLNGDFLLGDSDNNLPDLYYVKRRNTGSPTNMELHILTGKSTYTAFSSHIVLPLLHTDDANGDFALADFDGDGLPDLVFIKRRNTGTGTIELHVLGSRSKYTKFFLQTGTGLAAAEDMDGDFRVTDANGDGAPELVYIKRRNTAGAFVETHILDRASQFKNFVVHSVTMFRTADTATATFLLGDYNADGWKELVSLNPGTLRGPLQLDIAPLTHWLP